MSARFEGICSSLMESLATKIEVRDELFCVPFDRSFKAKEFVNDMQTAA